MLKLVYPWCWKVKPQSLGVSSLCLWDVQRAYLQVAQSDLVLRINKIWSTGRSAHHITERSRHALKIFELQIFSDLRKLHIVWCQNSSNHRSLLYWFSKTKFIWRNHFLRDQPFPFTGLENNSVHVQRFNILPVSRPCMAETLGNLCCILPSTGYLGEPQPPPSLTVILTLIPTSLSLSTWEVYKY